MSDDLFGQLQPATMQDALKASDPAPATRARVQKEAADVTPSDVPEPKIGRYLLVIDPSNLPEPYYHDDAINSAIIGRVAIPEEFCGLDSTGCDAVSDSRHSFSFTKDHGWWVHMSCGQPTRKWFRGAFLDLVETEDQELSWLGSESEGSGRGEQ